MQMRVIAQRYGLDCAVACVAMLCEVSYEESLLAFDHMVFREGAKISQVKAAAKRLGRTLRWSKHQPDLDEATGILCVGSDRWPNDHLVILWNGHIIDTDCTIWEHEVYMKAYHTRVMGILTLREGK